MRRTPGGAALRIATGVPSASIGHLLEWQGWLWTRLSPGSTTRTATHYTLKVDIGGLSGVLAPLLGKQPPDSHVWILGGEAPAFVKSEQPLYMGGPLWRIELVSPTWPRAGAAKH